MIRRIWRNESWREPSDKERVYKYRLVTGNNSDNNNKDYYELERGELTKHGMKLNILYL
jgi:hypothetical protein